MNCPVCDSAMWIDEWGGWVWTCVYCDHVDRLATVEEVRELERGMDEYYSKGGGVYA